MSEAAVQEWIRHWRKEHEEVEQLRQERDALKAALEARPKVYFPVEETAREVDNLLKTIDVAEKNTEDRQAEVERLQQERDALKEENDRLKSMDLHSSCHKREDAFKAALEAICAESFISLRTDKGFVVPSKMVHQWRSIARQALEGVTPSAS